MARLPNFWGAPAKLGSQQLGKKVGHIGGDRGCRPSIRTGRHAAAGLAAEAAMCELAAELKKAEVNR